MQLSRRVQSLKPSVTVAFTNRAKQMRAEGQDVLIFAAGEPDFDTPEPIKQAAIEALLAGQTKYVPTLGDPETRKVIANKLTTENGIPGLTHEHIAIGTGGKHVLFTALHALFDTPVGDEQPWEMLLPTPAWVSYAPICELAGGKVVEIPTPASNDFKITPEQLEAAITPRSRCLVLNSPSNPCGTMYSEEELRALAQVVAKATERAPDLVVLTDEIYEKIVYGEMPHFSIGSVPEIADRTITLNGLSKAFAMTGWRIGYVAMPGAFGKSFISALGKLHGQMTTNITSFNYAAIRCALTDDKVAEEVAKMRASFAERAKLVHSLLTDIPGVSCPQPTGAFYVFPDVSALFGRTTSAGKLIRDVNDLCEALLDEAGVAFVPGGDFGGCGINHCRISFACSEETIRDGMARFRTFVSTLNPL